MIPRACEPKLRGELRYNAPLKALNSWRVGGPAERLYRPADVADLACFLIGIDRDEPLLWLGLGSNLLIRDGGIRGTVIVAHGALDHIEQIGPRRVRAEAGVPCAKAARFAARHGMTGIEFMVGIPGTIGGALVMNAGAFGGETWDSVIAVETIDRTGVIRQRRATEFQVTYRRLNGLGEEWFVAAVMELECDDGETALAQIRSLLAKRTATQPTGVLSCGSVFRNPPRDHAARLIEACGLKGYTIGGACVSQKHANFIINTGQASAADIEALITFIQRSVESRHGISLIPEVCITGEALS